MPLMEEGGILTSISHLLGTWDWWGGGEGVLPHMGYTSIQVCAAVKGMVFKQFTLG